jgi:predicted  nucleic acid-binding Zn-ribbon protein
MTRTGFKFDARSDSPAPANAFMSTKGFQDAFLGDPSIKKLKDDIQQKEKQNMELEDEIQRLRYNLMDKVGDNEVVLGLQREVEIKEDQMKDRDEQLKALIDEKAIIENEKIALKKEMEQLKVKQLLEKNVGLLMGKANQKQVPAVSEEQLN